MDAVNGGGYRIRVSDWALVIHGGAGAMTRGGLTDERDAAARDALRRALEAGGAILAAGRGAIDAVEAAVRVLEDDPNFNAGKGATFTAEGRIELDAAIMDGCDRRAGSVTGTTATRNPIGLARAVMERSPHVFLQGSGADSFSAAQGLEQVDADYFHTDERWQQLQRTSSFDAEVKYGTVGAVARDMRGHVAAATSTGGLTAKKWGRVGDTPVVGAGTYADDRAGAVSATGSGEYYIRVGVGHEIGARVRFLGEEIVLAADIVQAEVKALGGSGGVIVVGTAGAGGWSFNTPGMYRGYSGPDGSAVAIYGDEG